jgi:hypothetical protein
MLHVSAVIKAAVVTDAPRYLYKNSDVFNLRFIRTLDQKNVYLSSEWLIIQ